MDVWGGFRGLGRIREGWSIALEVETPELIVRVLKSGKGGAAFGFELVRIIGGGYNHYSWEQDIHVEVGKFGLVFWFQFEVFERTVY
jgi:hypothetical protein